MESSSNVLKRLSNSSAFRKVLLRCFKLQKVQWQQEGSIKQKNQTEGAFLHPESKIIFQQAAETGGQDTGTLVTQKAENTVGDNDEQTFG